MFFSTNICIYLCVLGRFIKPFIKFSKGFDVHEQLKPGPADETQKDYPDARCYLAAELILESRSPDWHLLHGQETFRNK